MYCDGLPPRPRPPGLVQSPPGALTEVNRAGKTATKQNPVGLYCQGTSCSVLGSMFARRLYTSFSRLLVRRLLPNDGNFRHLYQRRTGLRHRIDRNAASWFAGISGVGRTFDLQPVYNSPPGRRNQPTPPYPMLLEFGDEYNVPFKGADQQAICVTVPMDEAVRLDEPICMRRDQNRAAGRSRPEE